MKELINRLRHPGTLIGLVGMIGLLLNQFGLNVDLAWLDATINIICSIMAVLGLTTDPTTPKVYIPLKKNKVEKEEEIL